MVNHQSMSEDCELLGQLFFVRNFEFICNLRNVSNKSCFIAFLTYIYNLSYNASLNN